MGDGAGHTPSARAGLQPPRRKRPGPPLGERPGFEDAVASGYRHAGGALPDDWRRLTLYNGLADWASFLGRPRINHALIDDARRMISRTLENW